ncbi:MAG: hypothetical protein ACJA0P_004369 [Planctomycetota bacterium]|jgi:hypothetical protein
MRSIQTTGGTSPSWLLVCLVAGVTSGLVTGAGLFLTMGRGTTERVERDLTLGPDAGSPELATGETLAAIRGLTEALERAALGALPRPATTRSAAAGSQDLLEPLRETLLALNEKLDRIADRSPGSSEATAHSIRESSRAQSIRVNEVTAVIDSLNGADGKSIKRSLHLRSIEYMVERFGMPTDVSGGNGSIHAAWRSGDHYFSVHFVDGVVAYIET